MLGIHTSEGTAEGWFGPGITSAIISIALLAISIIVLGGLITMKVLNAVGPNTPDIPPATTPIAPTTPTSSPTPTTSEPTPLPGVIEITAEKLVSDLLANPDKYKKGTVFQVSGTVLKSPPFDGTYLGPMIKTSSGARLSVTLAIDSFTIEGQRLINKLKSLNEEDGVVIQGEFIRFNPVDLDGAMVKNVSLVSVTPAK